MMKEWLEALEKVICLPILWIISKLLGKDKGGI